MALTMKTGNTWPSVEATLAVAGSVMNLTDATVMFVFGTAKRHKRIFERAAIVVDAENGLVRYVWQPADTEIAPGKYAGEFRITFPDGKIATVPNDGYISIVVHKSIA